MLNDRSPIAVRDLGTSSGPTKHFIDHIGDGFYGSNDPTNSVKALKEVMVLRIRLQSHQVHLTMLQYYTYMQYTAHRKFILVTSLRFSLFIANYRQRCLHDNRPTQFEFLVEANALNEMKFGVEDRPALYGR